jgi:hypothetical protein
MHLLKRPALLSTILLFTNTLSAQNQTIVKGSVVNEQNKAMPYVTVMATEKGKTIPYKGIITGEKGFFQLPLLQGKNYSVKIAFMGYKQATLNVNTDSLTVKDIGILKLEPQAIKLKEVVVRPLVELSTDEIIYNITSDPDREKSNMLQIFQKVPYINVMPNGKIIVGEPDKKVRVTRNGHIDALFNTNNMSLDDILRKLPAMGFTKIRVMLAPPKKYKDCDYVVDVTADEDVSLWGIVGVAQSGYNFGSGSTDNSISLNSSIDVVRVSGKIGATNTSSPESMSEEWLNTFKDNSMLEQHQTTGSSSDEYNGSLALSYDISKTQYIYMDLGFNQITSRSFASSSSQKNIADNVVEQYTSNNNRHSNSKSWSGQLCYQLDFKNINRSLNISYLITSNPVNDNNILRNQGILDYNNNSDLTITKTDAYNHKFQVDYSDRLAGFLPIYVGLGYLNQNYNSRISLFNDQNEVWIESTEQYSRQFRANQIIDGNLYSSLKINKRFSVSSHIVANYLINGAGSKLYNGNLEQNIKEKELIFSPDISLSYSLKNKKKRRSFSLSYKLSQLRPNLVQLSNYVDKTSPNFMKTGNPNLKPEAFHSFSLRLNNNFLSPSILYSFSNNKISTCWIKNSDEQLIQSYENANRYQSLGLSLFKVLIGKNNRYNISTHFTGSYIESKTTKGDISNGFRLNFIANGYLVICNRYSINGTFIYFDNWTKGYAINRNDMPVSANLKLNYGFLKDSNPIWVIGIGANIFGWNTGAKATVTTLDYELKDNSSIRKLPLSFSISYHFGKFKVELVKETRKKARISGFSDEKESGM